MSSLGISEYQINKQHEIMVGNHLVGTVSPTSYTLVTDALMPLSQSYTGIVSEFSHTTSLDLSLLAPTSVVFADIVDELRKIRGHWLSRSCKFMAKMDDKINNYLLTITWDAESKSIDEDKNLILQTLKEKLNIDSKS